MGYKHKNHKGLLKRIPYQQVEDPPQDGGSQALAVGQGGKKLRQHRKDPYMSRPRTPSGSKSCCSVASAAARSPGHGDQAEADPGQRRPLCAAEGK
jgi:hypothetical protein